MIKKIPYNHLFLFILIFSIGFFFRFYKLDTLPAELFGDMVENLDHTRSVLNGDFRFIYGYDGRQAMLFYINAFFSYFLGVKYLTLKITVATIGLLVVISGYFLGKSIKDKHLGITTMFFFAVSKYPVVFSRIGFRCILAPLFVMLVLIFLIRNKNYLQKKNTILAGFFLGLGLYTYYGFLFMLPVALVLFLFIIYTHRVSLKLKIAHIFLFLVFFTLSALPQIIDFTFHPQTYTSHPAQIFAEDNQIIADWPSQIVKNTITTNAMFFTRGDVVFRVNPPHQPALDNISRLFFLVGLLMLYIRYKVLGIVLLMSMETLLLPSILSLRAPVDVPSFTRVNGSIPFIFLITAIGFNETIDLIKTVLKNIKNKWFITQHIIIIFTTSTLFSIMVVNYFYYFRDYRLNLPNKNTGFGREIARFIKNDKAQHYYLVSCCWGEWGQPEPKGISYELSNPDTMTYLDPETFTCLDITDENALIITSPADTVLQEKIHSCLPNKLPKTISSQFGEPIFTYFK